MRQNCYGKTSLVLEKEKFKLYLTSIIIKKVQHCEPCVSYAQNISGRDIQVFTILHLFKTFYLWTPEKINYNQEFFSEKTEQHIDLQVGIFIIYKYKEKY